MARMQDLALKGPMPKPRYTGETDSPGYAARQRHEAARHHSAMAVYELEMAGAHAMERHGGSSYWFIRDRLYFSSCVIGERISYAAY